MNVTATKRPSGVCLSGGVSFLCFNERHGQSNCSSFGSRVVAFDLCRPFMTSLYNDDARCATAFHPSWASFAKCQERFWKRVQVTPHVHWDGHARKGPRGDIGVVHVYDA